MFSTCNSACVGSLTLTKTDQCDVFQRSEVPVRLLIAKCDFNFPEGDYDDNALATLIETAIDDGDISATPELAEMAWADPTTAQKKYKAGCRPPVTKNVSRVLTGKDFNATNVNSAGTAVPYEDRIFWQNIIQNKGTAIRGYVTCDGKIYLFLNKNGTFSKYSVHFFTGFDAEIEGESVEYKNYAITFMGDPVNYTTPYLDIIASEAEAQLGWLME